MGVPASAVDELPDVSTAAGLLIALKGSLPREGDFVVVSFDQDYRSDRLSNVMKKRQYWIREDGRWKILYEGAA